MLAARIAKLPGLHAFGVLLFVLRRRVVAVFAIAALQRNDFSHDFLSSPARFSESALLLSLRLSQDLKPESAAIEPIADGLRLLVDSEPTRLFISLESMEQNWRRRRIDSKISQRASTFMAKNDIGEGGQPIGGYTSSFSSLLPTCSPSIDDNFHVLTR